MAGAAAFRQNDLDEAARRFQGVLELPEAERTHYGLWANYMLGRVAYLNGDADAARAAFAAVRAAVEHGAADPLGLAATSLGDEARIYLDADDVAKAVPLYAEQAALGSVFGRDSLVQIAREAAKDETKLAKLTADPLGRRVFLAYLLTRSGELDGVSNGADLVGRFLDDVERDAPAKLDGADRFAALAYRGGRYDLAARLAALDTSGLAWWVRAKLALRRGDRDAAAAAYAQAAKAFPPDEQWGEPQTYIFDPIHPQCRVEGESGALAMSRGEYLEAMQHLYNAASQYWPDAAYVAERVLTVDELKHFVDAHPGAPKPAKPRTDDGDFMIGLPDDALKSLRALLARRLVRADRLDDALAYFDDPELKKKAQAYADARHSASRGGRIEEARAWYAAAYAARVDGLDLMAYELDPDYAIYGGSFDLGVDYDGDTDAVPRPRKDVHAPAVLAGPDEAARLAASRAAPYERYHYRYVAAGFAQKSADLLPPRSQAFAAVLCHATSWLIDRDPAFADKIYARYLKQGAYVPWGAEFGRSCPEPDFDGAARRLQAERVAYYRHLARRAKPYALAAAAL